MEFLKNNPQTVTESTTNNLIKPEKAKEIEKVFLAKLKMAPMFMTERIVIFIVRADSLQTF